MPCLTASKNAGCVSLLGQTHNHHLWLHLLIVLLDSPILPPANCSESITTTTPSLSHMSLFGAADCFNSSGTHFVGTLDSADRDNAMTLSDYHTVPKSKYSRVSAERQSTAAYLRWSGTCALVFHFPKSGLGPGEEPLLISITEFRTAGHY